MEVLLGVWQDHLTHFLWVALVCLGHLADQYQFHFLVEGAVSLVLAEVVPDSKVVGQWMIFHRVCVKVCLQAVMQVVTYLPRYWDVFLVVDESQPLVIMVRHLVLSLGR